MTIGRGSSYVIQSLQTSNTKMSCFIVLYGLTIKFKKNFPPRSQLQKYLTSDKSYHYFIFYLYT